jgi:hypothetical protein
VEVFAAIFREDSIEGTTATILMEVRGVISLGRVGAPFHPHPDSSTSTSNPYLKNLIICDLREKYP